MNAKLNPLSNATKASSLLAAVMITVGLQGVLLWQMNEVAESGAQSAMLEARAPATARVPATGAGPVATSLTPVYRLALEPVTVVARREPRTSELKLASASEPAASSVGDGTPSALAGKQEPVYLN